VVDHLPSKQIPEPPQKCGWSVAATIAVHCTMSRVPPQIMQCQTNLGYRLTVLGIHRLFPQVVQGEQGKQKPWSGPPYLFIFQLQVPGGIGPGWLHTLWVIRKYRYSSWTS
jgi:hypothetical protein